MEIFKNIQTKFSCNFSKAIDLHKDKLEEAEVKSRILYSFGRILKSNAKTRTEEEISEIYNEVFSDLAISIYLSLSSIDNASKILLRRTLELGIATIYFWDLPYRFWGWKKSESYETDLNFKDILDHLNSTFYKEYLTNEFRIENWTIDKNKINQFYRKLSNVIHGKYISFETTHESSYEFIEKDYTELLDKIIFCENILINCNSLRFAKQFSTLKEKMPSIERYNYEY